jgi:hypothetical protein
MLHGFDCLKNEGNEKGKSAGLGSKSLAAKPVIRPW